MKIMVLGDYHGDVSFITEHVIPAALAEGVNTILQVGDFGYGDHRPVWSLNHDYISASLAEAGIEMYHIQGNHDKISYLMQNYARHPSKAGFVNFRPSLYFIPNGTCWKWGSTSFIAFGGAYSVDKSYRLKLEKKEGVPSGTYWFPEEEMREQDFERYLCYVDRTVDAMVTHDAPSSSDLGGVPLSSIFECEPNRHRLQKAVRTLRPKLLLHGHFHHRYETQVRCGDDGSFTHVVGLGANTPGSWNRHEWRPEDAWVFLSV